MNWEVDTNIHLRLFDEGHAMHAVARTAADRLLGTGETLCCLPQNIREFWNVCTRPTYSNGLGLTHTQVEAEVERIESTFVILSDGPEIQREWRKLVLAHRVSGVQVHDCYIAAAMKVHGIDKILTFNTADFARYAVDAVHPADV